VYLLLQSRLEKKKYFNQEPRTCDPTLVGSRKLLVLESEEKINLSRVGGWDAIILTC
jgi:hypothetical protein